MSSPRQPDHEGLQQDYSGLETFTDSAANAPEVDLSRQEYTQQKHHLDENSPPPPPTILGFPKRTFWICIAIAGIVIVAVAAVVGGIEGSRHRHSTSLSTLPSTSLSSSTKNIPISTSATTPGLPSSATTSLISTSATVSGSSSSTSSASTALPTSGLLALDCPTLNGTSYTSTQGGTKYDYTVICSTDFPGNDLSRNSATTLDNCVDQCASWTASSATSSEPCEGIVFNANLTSSVNQGGNCFLKSSVQNGELANNGDGTVGAAVWNQ